MQSATVAKRNKKKEVQKIIGKHIQCTSENKVCFLLLRTHSS